MPHPDHTEPTSVLPPEKVHVHDGGVRQVGDPGKVGILRARFVVGANGRTGLRERYAKAPVSITRPLYINPAEPHHAYLYTRMTGGGLAQNDRIRHTITLDSAAHATITTQAATNVHRMNSGYAAQLVNFTVANNALLEYLPGHTTLFGGSRLIQSTEFTLAPTATLFAAETTMLGRLARGEVHQFDELTQSLRIQRGQRPLLTDRTIVEACGQGRSPLIFGSWPVWSTLLIVPPQPWAGTAGIGVSGLCDELREHARELSPIMSTSADSEPALQWGISTLAMESGILARVAGYTTGSVHALTQQLYSHARQKITGNPAIDLRTNPRF